MHGIYKCGVYLVMLVSADCVIQVNQHSSRHITGYNLLGFTFR